MEEELLYRKLNDIENNLMILKSIVLSKYKNKLRDKKAVSFRGIAKSSLTEKELDEAIEESKHSLFPHKRIGA